jgi:glycerophosphoryl diester phosphodiesterase
MSPAADPSFPEIIAHRGASFDAPENTLASFRLGWKQGADAGELDIQLSSDGEAVVLHDSSTKRTAGLDKAAASQTLAELKQLDAGFWKDKKWAAERIPTLAEALAILPSGKKMFIEIKCGPEILPELEKVMKASGKKPSQLVLIGFNYETMRQAKQLLPRHETYWLVSYKNDPETGRLPEIGTLIDKVQAAGMDGLNLDFNFPMDAAFVSKVKAAGLKLYTWTVDNPVIAGKLRAAGINGITTNRPGWMREQL